MDNVIPTELVAREMSRAYLGRADLFEHSSSGREAYGSSYVLRKLLTLWDPAGQKKNSTAEYTEPLSLEINSHVRHGLQLLLSHKQRSKLFSNSSCIFTEGWNKRETHPAKFTCIETRI